MLTLKNSPLTHYCSLYCYVLVLRSESLAKREKSHAEPSTGIKNKSNFNLKFCSCGLASETCYENLPAKNKPLRNVPSEQTKKKQILAKAFMHTKRFFSCLTMSVLPSPGKCRLLAVIPRHLVFSE